MENHIFEPNKDFVFSNISLGQPTTIQGGAYFTKILYKDKPFFIETPKSLTKQGFVKNGKKMFCDLMFDNTNEEFINWVENLETKCQQLIHDKGDEWFQNKLEMNDIETAFTSTLRIYKSGKYYLMRVNVKMNYNTNIPLVKIYNESEVPLNIDDIKSDTNIISIIEIQGIKFTSRNFQVELEMKQAMVLNTYEMFESCLIKRNPGTKPVIETKINNLEEMPVIYKSTFVDPLSVDRNMEEMLNDSSKSLISINTDGDPSLEEFTPDIENDALEENHYSEIISQDIEKENDKKQKNDIKENVDALNINSGIDLDKNNKKLEQTNIQLNMEEKETPDQVKNGNDDINIEFVSHTDMDNDELKEMNDINFDIDTLEPMKLKKPNEFYYEIYKKAKEKAKQAKKDMLIAYLEAKNIKKTYMLDDLEDDSDSDISLESDLDLENDENEYFNNEN
uniref:Uncharacterized protein n=1 Tax=viral metagenome TaxID=1070528 RepID=A0A6C0HAF7_9ZZZZ